MSELPKVVIELNRADELTGLISAASELGDIAVRALNNPAEARARLVSQEFARLGRKYPGETAQALMSAATSIWPTARVAEHTDAGATHVVTEITFTGSHGRRDLYAMAHHGFTEGFGAI